MLGLYYLFALLGAFLVATYYALTKNNLKNIDPFILPAGIFLSTSVFLFIVSFIKGIPEIKSGFLLAVLVTCSLNVVATLLYFKALKNLDISLAVSLLSFTPVFTILTSYLILHEVPSRTGVFGILLIVFGIYVLNINEKVKDVFAPIKELFTKPDALYVLAVAFIYSISSNFNKITVVTSDPFFSSAVVYLLLSISFFIISFISRRDFRQLSSNIFPLLLDGLVLSAAAVSINIALTRGIVPYVIALNRTSILFSLFYGWLFFKEKNLSKKFFGALIIFLGIILIIMSSS